MNCRFDYVLITGLNLTFAVMTANKKLILLIMVQNYFVTIRVDVHEEILLTQQFVYLSCNAGGPVIVRMFLFTFCQQNTKIMNIKNQTKITVGCTVRDCKGPPTTTLLLYCEMCTVSGCPFISEVVDISMQVFL